MTFKTITIKKGVFTNLLKVKQKSESFSDLFARLLKDKRPDLQEFYGAWEVSKAEEKKVHEGLKKFRREFEESFRRHESSGQ
ncbi:hypothetical protein HY489_00985 [Candidatus Woesearchaeota archaeon]|nr:hypothetical protein [Candidatus Woesearchaeota archaeon]